MKSFSQNLVFLFTFLAITGCVNNEAFRKNITIKPLDEKTEQETTDGEPKINISDTRQDIIPEKCTLDNCTGKSYIEEHSNFDLAYVEFSEFGNLFDRDRMKNVLKYLEQLQEEQIINASVNKKLLNDNFNNKLLDRKQLDKEILKIDSSGGLHVLVFVHGWKHNASHKDENVKKFKERLKKIASLGPVKSKKLIGIYVGWRGSSLNLPGLENLSYSERKNVAHQVGKGGVTELLLKLETILNNDPIHPNKNIFLVVGHSFGSAIVLSGLNEILLERIVSGKIEGQKECIKTRSFGHGIVLINPAVEANEILKLKELAFENCFTKTQDRFMHIISSEADTATSTFFPIGQWFAGLRWNHVELERNYLVRKNPKEGAIEKPLFFDESDLNTNTIGNFQPFHTGYLTTSESDPQLANHSRKEKAKREYSRKMLKAKGCLKDKDQWDYHSYLLKSPTLPEGENEITDCYEEHYKYKFSDLKEQHIPAKYNEPLAFIKTDGNFIKDHNDVFNDNVAAYIGAIASEARFKRCLDGTLVKPVGSCSEENVKALSKNLSQCYPKKNYSTTNDSKKKEPRFNFGGCFNAYLKIMNPDSDSKPSP